jgi:hypothetical protein
MLSIEIREKFSTGNNDVFDKLTIMRMALKKTLPILPPVQSTTYTVLGNPL